MKPATLIYAIIFSIFFINGSYAQTGFSIGSSGSYLYSYRTLKQENGNAGYKQLRDRTESPMSSYQFSIDALYQFKNKLCVGSGIGYSNVGYQIKDADKAYGDIWTRRGFSDNIPNLEHVNLNYRLLRLSVPLMLGYRLGFGENSNHSMLFRIGLNNNFLLQSSASIILIFENGEKEEDDETIRVKDNVYSLSACANIGYFYKIARHNIGISLLGDYGLTPVNRNTAIIKQYPYFGGVGLSYFYSFN